MGLSSARKLAAAYGCLVLAWVFAVPPFSAPDEWSHYLRTVGIAHGRVLGAPVQGFRDPNLSPRQEAWVAQTVRWTEVPPGMAPDGYGCNAFRPAVSAACAGQVPPPPGETVRRLTVNGTYQPGVYLVPALLARAADGPVSGLRLGRIANALTCLALLAAAAWALRPHLLGLVVAVTPMALFIGAALNPSGPEIAGAIALTAGLLALARGSGGAAGWWAAAAGGAALCLARPLGPLWLAILGATCVTLCGLRGAWGAIRAAPRSAAWAAAVVGATAVINGIWEHAYGPHLSASRREPIGFALRESLRTLPRWIREQIGVYQYLDSPMPGFAYLLWTGLVLLLALAAVRAGTRRDRLAVAFAVASALGVPVLLEAFAMRPIDWAVQGRHVLPLSVAVPMVAAEVLVRNERRLGRFAVGAAAICAFVHLVGFYSDGRRSAVGTAGSWLFPLQFEWSPPLGWWPWLLLATAGAAIMAAVRLEPT
jgi:hypothetical protein